MNKKDLLARELKNLMEEDTRKLELSQDLINNMVKPRQAPIKERLNNFLNQEIEIPLAPVIIGFAALLIITTFPRDILSIKKVQIIDAGNNQILIRDKGVGCK